MRQILVGEHRLTVSIENARRAPSQGAGEYEARLREQFAVSGAQIAWLCVPPGAHVTAMVRATLQAGLHVVAEKPWFGSPEETAGLTQLARERKRIAAVHYEYCLLKEVDVWRAQFSEGYAITFSGRFHHSRKSHSGIPALDNLGTHLLSIREWAAPRSRVGTIDCTYGRRDERRVWLERDAGRLAEIDLLASKEPIIQRFISRLETALESAAFPFDLQFALRVAETATVVKRRAAAVAD
jgi:predicted dehydrogenase